LPLYRSEESRIEAVVAVVSHQVILPVRNLQRTKTPDRGLPGVTIWDESAAMSLEKL
jgi:hypothetical protein